jgi:hypothetical protein
MTHDELLAYVDFAPLDGLMSWLQPGLRAVVELHKPNHPFSIQGDLKCAGCDGLDFVDYPCLTIQAIEAVLND